MKSFLRAALSVGLAIVVSIFPMALIIDAHSPVAGRVILVVVMAAMFGWAIGALWVIGAMQESGR